MSNWGKYLYNRLPKVYRVRDNGEQLKRYLDTLGQAGYAPLYMETQQLINLIDPNTCPAKFLPLLCETFGIKYFDDIPDRFQRRFLSRIMTLYQTKGTVRAIEYLARELSGFPSTVNRIIDEQGNEQYLVRMDSFEDYTEQMLLAQDVIKRYLWQFVPIGISVELVVSYGFSDIREDDSYFEDDVPSITDKILQIRDSQDEITENWDIAIDDQEDVLVMDKQHYSSIANIAEVNVTFVASRINGKDIITENGVTTEILY